LYIAAQALLENGSVGILADTTHRLVVLDQRRR
jgi:hypothetical protein